MSRISIVFSGGVSLCTYEAGVASAIIQSAYENDDFEISVVGGSSAGAITAFLTAYTLNRGMNPIYLKNLIVDAADIRCMLSRDKNILLSLNSMKQIFYDLQREGEECSFAYGKAGCVKNRCEEFCGRKICREVKKRDVILSIGMTAAEGYISDVNDSLNMENYLTKNYHESYIVDFKRFRDYDKDHLFDLLLSSASYPVAFEPRNIIMKRGEMEDLSSLYKFDKAAFNFTDGGISDDLPMRAVLNLSDNIDCLALVIPCPENYRSFIDYTDNNSGFGPPGSMIKFLSEVFSVISFQSISFDMKSFAKTNALIQRCAEVEERLDKEYESMNSEEKAVIDRYLKAFIGDEEPEKLKLRSILKYASHTENKRGIKLVSVSPENPEVDLEGEILFHFGGFFDKRMRESDFRTGYCNGHKFADTLGMKIPVLFRKSKIKVKNVRYAPIAAMLAVKLLVINTGQNRKNILCRIIFFMSGIIYDFLFYSMNRNFRKITR